MEYMFILLIAVAIWGIVIFNLLVRDKNRVLAAWSDIDVQLKRRHDLIPKLVDAVKQYASYESSTITAVTELRKQSEAINTAGRKGEIEKELTTRLHNLIAIAEDYPELKASQSFLDLQRNLTEVEEFIQFARRYYNGAVRNLNVRIQSFPDMFVARMFGFQMAEFFEFEQTGK
ncbi:MAG: LemA family protein [Gammaproteobacteria bacterium]|nr:LemA family protein [Gammaproteobacteria bacterium]NIN62558.1 LemA family protein [Gammaproteobacteria bacterium]NIO63121.1 LemA family protein [Gammaproteobacteria bacterium]NIP48498.1 LemA family protein [Gammaproteobacteria bacterium]NIQ08532.1 LemA family protein [Gammaproteobacteria bacterium]